MYLYTVQLWSVYDADDNDIIDCCSTVQGPHQVASRMVTVLKHIIGESTWTSAR